MSLQQYAIRSDLKPVLLEKKFLMRGSLKFSEESYKNQSLIMIYSHFQQFRDDFEALIVLFLQSREAQDCFT